MGPDVFSELERRAANAGATDQFAKLETASRVAGEIERLKAEGKALELTDEEEQMLRSFRRFKLRMRKSGEVFTWQSCLPEGVRLAQETGCILDPREVVR